MDVKLFVPGFKIHFIGIGGISMSALAHILLDDGCTVTGSDTKESHITKDLEKYGAKITYSHSADNISDQDLVVYTAAIKEDNPEYMRAKELGIELAGRAELLGALMKNYDTPIAVSGTHGKTSTTGMVSQIFLENGKDPTVTIGGELDSIGGNLRVGGKEVFIAEACEYHRSFLSFFPRISLILNIEEDHLDYFKDIDDIISAFRSFALLTPEDGAVIVNKDDKSAVRAVDNIGKKVITFAVNSPADFTAKDIVFDETDRCVFKIFKNGEYYAQTSLSVPGIHNVYNALAAFAAADFYGIDKDAAAKAIYDYKGAHRRFEKKGRCNGALVVDDYAHHPSEIKATLRAANEMHFDNIWCVFQPHTYSRTKALFNDFVEAFEKSGVNVIITDIYAAREKDTGLVSAKELSDAIDNSIYMKEFSDVEKYLKERLTANTLLLTMGAGDVYKIGEHIVD